jgi:hypothetical protein
VENYQIIISQLHEFNLKLQILTWSSHQQKEQMKKRHGFLEGLQSLPSPASREVQYLGRVFPGEMACLQAPCTHCSMTVHGEKSVK